MSAISTAQPRAVTLTPAQLPAQSLSAADQEPQAGPVSPDAPTSDVFKHLTIHALLRRYVFPLQKSPQSTESALSRPIEHTTFPFYFEQCRNRGGENENGMHGPFYVERRV